MVICPVCGNNEDGGNFCSVCGSRLKTEDDNSKSANTMIKCPNCGFMVDDGNFCPECGSKLIHDGSSIQKTSSNESYSNESQSAGTNEGSDFVDGVMDFDDKISDKYSGLSGKSRVMNKVNDKIASFNYKNIEKSANLGSTSRKYFEKIEPVFLEVFDSIDDKLVKAVLIHERSLMGSTSGAIGTVLSQVYTPTKGLSHDEAVSFYQDMVNKIVAEINDEKQKGAFDEEEFYKRKFKENTQNNKSFLGISKSLKAYKKNRNKRS